MAPPMDDGAPQAPPPQAFMPPPSSAPVVGDGDDPFGADASNAFLRSQSRASGSFADSLPTMESFRARDEAAKAEAMAPRGDPFLGGMDGSLGGARPPSAPPSPQELLQERMFELFSFDTIDDRPADEPQYDWTARLIGRGLPNKTGTYLLPYLQSGHMLLFGVLLLCSLVSYPGFPLTEVPDAYRSLLLQGLGINLLMNILASLYARGIAEKKEEPVGFWQAKVILLGGLALGELSEAVPDPVKPRTGRGAGF